MSLARLQRFAIRFVNNGIIPMIEAEVQQTLAIEDNGELEAAATAVRLEVRQFFEGLRSLEEFGVRLTSLPGKNYLKLRMIQHILTSRLARLQTPQVLTEHAPPPTEDQRSEAFDEEQFSRMLSSRFGLTDEERQNILENGDET